MQGLEHSGGTAAAHVMTVHSNVLAGGLVIGLAQREQAADNALRAVEGVIQIVVHIIGQHHRVIHIGAGNL